jgi:hypothetical protein
MARGPMETTLVVLPTFPARRGAHPSIPSPAQFAEGTARGENGFRLPGESFPVTSPKAGR